MNEKEEMLTIADIYGEDVFSDRVMRARLPKNVYRELHQTMEEGSDLNPLVADEIAEAMKQAEVNPEAMNPAEVSPEAMNPAEVSPEAAKPEVISRKKAPNPQIILSR